MVAPPVSGTQQRTPSKVTVIGLKAWDPSQPENYRIYIHVSESVVQEGPHLGHPHIVVHVLEGDSHGLEGPITSLIPGFMSLLSAAIYSCNVQLQCTA